MGRRANVGVGTELPVHRINLRIFQGVYGKLCEPLCLDWGLHGCPNQCPSIVAEDQSVCPSLGHALRPFLIPNGIRLVPGLIEVITDASSQAGERHEHLAQSIGKIALLAWRGHSYIVDPDIDTAGVDWILAEEWWPYQRPTFVTPPFAGYTSGHSTFSRAAAEIMTLFTGDEYFPGGMGEFYCPQNQFLVFEDGPSMDVTLQWAKYGDASDQCSLSRIWGGIHPGADDLPGRQMGLIIGPDSFCEASRYYTGQFNCPADVNGDGTVGITDLLELLGKWNSADCNADVDRDETVGITDFLAVLVAWGPCS